MNSSWGSGADVDANQEALDTLSVDHGASVASVVQNVAVLAAGILVGDVMVQLDNTPVTDPQSLGEALAEYRVGPQQVRFWLEWDRGTMNVRDLAVKFTSYAHARRLA